MDCRRSNETGGITLERLPSSRGCFICGKDNPIGLKVAFTQTPSGAQATVHPGKEFSGFEGVLQGGVVAGLMDDAMWYAIYAQSGIVTMTAELTVRYKAPVPVATDLIVSAELVEQRRSLRTCRASITLADGSLLAEASGKFMPAPATVAERLQRELC